MKETHITNTQTKIDGTARCAAESALGPGEEVGTGGSALGAGEEVGAGTIATDIIAANTTLEMEVRPCMNTNWCLK